MQRYLAETVVMESAVSRTQWPHVSRPFCCQSSDSWYLFCFSLFTADKSILSSKSRDWCHHIYTNISCFSIRAHHVRCTSQCQWINTEGNRCRWLYIFPPRLKQVFWVGQRISIQKIITGKHKRPQIYLMEHTIFCCGVGGLGRIFLKLSVHFSGKQ